MMTTKQNAEAIRIINELLYKLGWPKNMSTEVMTGHTRHQDFIRITRASSAIHMPHFTHPVISLLALLMPLEDWFWPVLDHNEIDGIVIFFRESDSLAKLKELNDEL